MLVRPGGGWIEVMLMIRCVVRRWGVVGHVRLGLVQLGFVGSESGAREPSRRVRAQVHENPSRVVVTPPHLEMLGASWAGRGRSTSRFN